MKNILHPFAILTVAALLAVSACEDAGDGTHATRTVVSSPERTSAYDPTVVNSTDKRPDAPSVNEITPAQIDANGNNGTLIPMPAAGGVRR